MENSQAPLPDNPPTPERDTSRKGREEEVINQQEEDQITNKDYGILNGTAPKNSGTGERQYKEGMADNTVKLNEADKNIIEGSDRTGSEESGIPGSGI